MERAAGSGSKKPIWVGLGLVVLLGGLFAAGYLPKQARERELAANVKKEKTTLPEVNVAAAKNAATEADLVLPGNITPLTEAVINGRAEGYLRKRYADIGDRVRPGQLLAEVEAPELEQQVQQARASLAQTRAGLGHAQQGLAQSQANLRLADLTVQRWKTLADRGVVSKQELDQRQAAFETQQATVQSAESDVRAAEENIRASEANVARVSNLQGYVKITAPFAGVVTARNVDVGSLITTNGSTPLFRIAQIDTLRIMVDVPEQSAPMIRIGEPAEVTLQEFPGRKFLGKVSRTANSLDAGTRTLPTEVQVPNADRALLPNMYAQVRLIGVRLGPAILVPGDALVVRPEGTLVAIVGPGNKLHFQPVEVGRDYGPEIEIRSGLKAGDRVVVNPTDEVREGAVVNPLLQKPKAPAAGGKK